MMIRATHKSADDYDSILKRFQSAQDQYCRNRASPNATDTESAQEAGFERLIRARNDLIEASYERLRQMAHRLLRDDSLGRETQPTGLVHDACLRFLSEHDRNPCLPVVTLLGLMNHRLRYALLDVVRERSRRWRERAPGDSGRQVADSGARPSAPVIADEDRDPQRVVEYLEAVDRLPQELRAMVELRICLTLDHRLDRPPSFERCARILDIDEKTAASRFRRAIEILPPIPVTAWLVTRRTRHAQ